jgi:hypothetical protein
VKLRTLAWVLGGAAVSFVIAILVFCYLLLFTRVLAPWQQETMYTCTACLKADPKHCKTLQTDWEHPYFEEEDVRKTLANRLCDEVIPPEEDRVKNTCGHWANDKRDEIFDMRCTSRIERRKKPLIIAPVH